MIEPVSKERYVEIHAEMCPFGCKPGAFTPRCRPHVEAAYQRYLKGFDKAIGHCANCSHRYADHYNSRGGARLPCHHLSQHDMRCECRDLRLAEEEGT